MAETDKNQAVITFLLTCPQIASNRVFFNYINGEDNDKQILTVSTERNMNKSYIDGSVLKRYTFTLIDFRSISDQALVRLSGYTSENVGELLDVQHILDWVEEQADLGNYPNFGENCEIVKMQTSTNIPNLNGIDASVKPALAKYSMSIHIDYVDNTKKIWR